MFWVCPCALWVEWLVREHRISEPNHAMLDMIVKISDCTYTYVLCCVMVSGPDQDRGKAKAP